MSEWQPIETAPKDGTIVLLSHGRFVGTGWWEKEPGWAWKGEAPCWALVMCEDDYYSHYTVPEWPTHWMPLPEPPK